MVTTKTAHRLPALHHSSLKLLWINVFKRIDLFKNCATG